jgi:UDP-N-acetylglucosamine/UDP-N-acetylgalactosamine diphosphorylase
MLESSIRDHLFKLGQQQLLAGIEHLSKEELRNFADRLQKYSPALLAQQKEALFRSRTLSEVDLHPHLKYERSGNAENCKRGESLIRQGKVGCLILAGGQGTRLGFDGPKGSFPISPIKGKSLFQLFCERTRAASIWSGHPLPLCIMTSAANHSQTVDFLQNHHYFGLPPSQVFFIEQEMLPLLDDRGHWLLESPGKIAEGPDGNGQALNLFFARGIWEKWKALGIEYLNVIFVDNALADPFDPEFVGFTEQAGVDAALKAVERLSPDEKMGILAECAGKLKVIEYSEIPANASQFTLSSTGMFCISMEFIRYLYQDSNVALPLHLARKTAPVLLGTAKGLVQEMARIWKCERFIFDLLDYARCSAVLVCPREKIYAPLKNATGEKGVETVKQALLVHDREIYRALTGLLPKASAFELDPVFYYPTEELKQKLNQMPLLDQDYISAD